MKLKEKACSSGSKLSLFCVTVSMALIAVAGTKTWNPTVPDGGVYKWNNAANWLEGGAATSVPANGDMLEFDSSSAAIEAVNDITGLEIAGMTFTGANAITLSGNKIDVAANGMFTADSTAIITLALPMDLGGSTVFASTGARGSGATYEFTGAIGGAGGIATGGEWSGTYNFRAANTYEGRTYLTNGIAFNVYNGGAFGSAAADTYYSIRNYFASINANDSIAPLYFHGVTIDEPFKVWGFQSRSLVFPANTTNVLNGDIYSSDIGNVERWFLGNKTRVVCKGIVDLTSTAQLNTGDNSELVFSNKVVLSRASNGVRNAPSSNGGVIRYAGDIDIGNANFIVYSTGLSILDKADIFGANGGKVVYSYNGSIEVRGGHQYFKTITGNTFTTAILTSNDGTEVELLNSGSNYAGKFTGNLFLNIANGAKYAPAGQHVALMTNGVHVARLLSYGATGSGADVIDDDHFTGTGKFIDDAPQYKTWIGAAAGGDLDDGANWTPSSGVPVAGDFVSITGCTAGATFTGSLALGAGGSLSISDSPSVTFTAPIALQGTGNVTIDVQSASTAYFTGVISGPASAALVTKGGGDIHFSGANTFDGALIVRNKYFWVESDGAFGSAVGSTTLNRADYSGVQQIYFTGVTNSETIVVAGAGSTKHCILSGTNVFNGAWSRSTEQMRFGICNNSYTEFNHDFGDINYLTVDPDGSSTSGAVMVFNATFTAGQPRFGGGATYIFKTPVTMSRNTTGYGFTYNLNGGTIRLDGDYILNLENKCPTLSIPVSTVNGTVDLYGHDENVANVSGAPKAGGSAKITSSTGPATLHVLNNLANVLNNGAYAGSFSGELSVSVEGNSALNALTLSGASDSTGTLIATNGGKVVMQAGASWAGDVKICDGSRIEAANASTAFAETASIVVENGGKLKLTAGELTVASLTLGDTSGVTETSYGPEGSGADVESSLLEGAGIIRVAAPIVGITRTWAGPSGGNWNTAANWSPTGVPSERDTLVFDSSSAAISSVNDISGLILSGIDFAGTQPIALSGAAVTLRDGSALAASSCSAEITVGIPLATPAEGSIAVTATSNATGAVTWNLTAPFSGAGDIHFGGDHSATVNFHANSPSYDGVLHLTNAAAYHVWNDGAFGTTAGHTFHAVTRGDDRVNVEKFISPIWFHGVTTSENFILRGFTSFDLCCANGVTNTFNGTVDAESVPSGGNRVTERWWFGTNSVTRFNGAVGMKSLGGTDRFLYIIMHGQAGSRVDVNGECDPRRMRQRMERSGTLSINHPLDPATEYLGAFWEGTLAFGCADVLLADPARPVQFFFGTRLNNIVDLAGFDQTFGKMGADDGETKNYVTFTNSGAYATMTLALPGDFSLPSKLSGDMGLCLASNVTFTLGAANTATGTLSLTNGATANFAGNGRWAGAAANVVGDSRLVLDDVRLDTGASLSISSGGKVSLVEGVRQGVASLSFDGIAQTAFRSYGSSQSPADVKDDARFEGKGVVYVVGEVADTVRTWQGSSGGSWSVAANWSPAGVPQTGDTLVFDATSAPVDAVNDLGLFYAKAVELKGANAIRLSGNALGIFDLGGISAADGTTAAFELDLVMRGTRSDFDVDILPDANSTFVFSGAIGGDAHINVGGAGKVEFRGVNTFDGNLSVTNGTFDAYGDAAFGSTVGKTVFSAPAGVACQYNFNGVRTGDDVEWSQADGGYRGQFAAGTTNAFNGTFTGLGGQPRFNLADDAYLAFGGIVSNVNFITINTSPRSTVEIMSPLYCGTPRLSGVGTFIVHDRLVTSSESYSIAFGVGQQDIRLKQPDVLCITDSLTNRFGAAFLSMDAGTMDLCGNSQKAACFVGETTCVLTNSGAAATLHVLQTVLGNNDSSVGAVYHGEFRGVVAGPVTLSIEGSPDPAPYLFTGAGVNVPTQYLNGVSKSLDALIATNSAIIAFKDGGRWSGTNVTVHAGSKIIVDSGKSLSRAADVYLESDGKLVLPEGVTQRCRYLYINGVRQGKGTWGSGEAGSPAADTIDATHFEGKGVFRAVGETGVALSFR